VSARCPHAYRPQPTADDDLEVCSGCGRIVRPLSHSGELEIARLGARYGVDELAHDGGADYAVRIARPETVHPVRPQPQAVGATPRLKIIHQSPEHEDETALFAG